jgi:uncharacterized membrane protein
MRFDRGVAAFKYRWDLLFRENDSMETRFLIITLLLTALLVPYALVYGQSHVEYTIRIADDGSALWTVTQTGTDIQVSNDTIVEFQQKIALLLESARNATSRDMVANTTSITITPSGSYVVVEYKFYWANLSKTENARITIGDVFQASDFFLQLYGDGEVLLIYPPEYVVEAVSPAPYEQRASSQTIRWLGTLNFNNGQPSIVLRKASSSALMGFLEQNVLLILGGVITTGGLSAGLYMLREHKRKKKAEKKRQPSTFLLMENDEDKIMKLLRSSGGSMYQSAVVNQCRFSKAKTSQLLASLENKDLISRYKKGRDKIVSIVEPSKSES